MLKKSLLVRTILLFGISGLVVACVVFIFVSFWIGNEVNSRCKQAQSQYEGDCVDALIQVVASDENSFTERNYAIWSLGQLGDTRAQQVLSELYTGIIPEREPYDQGLSQYELKKALAHMEKEDFNISRLVWQFYVE